MGIKTYHTALNFAEDREIIMADMSIFSESNITQIWDPKILSTEKNDFNYLEPLTQIMSRGKNDENFGGWPTPPRVSGSK